MDRHRLAVVVKGDDFQEPPGPVGTDVEITIALAHNADGIADCVLDVLVGNTVLARAVRDLHLCRLPCSMPLCKVTFGAAPVAAQRSTAGAVFRRRHFSQPLTVHGPEDAKLSSEDSTSSPYCRRGGA